MIKLKKNQCLCPYCGQTRPFPTEPGEWEYTECPTVKGSVWTRVSIVWSKTAFNYVTGEPNLEIQPKGQSEPIWWPVPSAWRKVKNVKKNKRKS
jgi:hypothetical protein